MFSKKIRNRCIDFLEDMCNKSRFSKKTLGHMLRAFHLSVPPIMKIGRAHV